VGQLINGDNFPVVGEKHGAKDRGRYGLHGVHVASSEKDIVIQLGIYDF
jgi:hypothetical protein